MKRKIIAAVSIFFMGLEAAQPPVIIQQPQAEQEWFAIRTRDSLNQFKAAHGQLNKWVNLQLQGETLLHLLVGMQGKPSLDCLYIVEELNRAGAQVDIPNGQGQLASQMITQNPDKKELHIIIKGGKAAALEQIRIKGIDLTRKPKAPANTQIQAVQPQLPVPALPSAAMPPALPVSNPPAAVVPSAQLQNPVAQNPLPQNPVIGEQQNPAPVPVSNPSSPTAPVKQLGQSPQVPLKQNPQLPPVIPPIVPVATVPVSPQPTGAVPTPPVKASPAAQDPQKMDKIPDSKGSKSSFSLKSKDILICGSIALATLLMGKFLLSRNQTVQKTDKTAE
jgi:hypothetical protein